MPVNAPENVSCRQHGDWLWVGWSYIPLESGDTLAGFKVKWGLDVLPVAWTVPPAVDSELLGGDGGSPREYYSLLFRLSDGLICDWESFETYPLGTVGVMDDNVGGIWDGATVIADNYIGNIAKEDFEGYPLGAAGTLNKGFGWNGSATLMEL